MPRNITKTTVTINNFAQLVIDYAIASKSKRPLALRDAIVRTSKKHGTNHYLDPYLYKKTEQAVISLICTAKAATLFDSKQTPLNGRSVGKYNNLLGVRIAANANTRNVVPEWAKGTQAEVAFESQVTGHNLPNVVLFKSKRTAALDADLDAPDDDWLNGVLKEPAIKRDSHLKVFTDALEQQLRTVRESKTRIDDLTRLVKNLQHAIEDMKREPAYA